LVEEQGNHFHSGIADSAFVLAVLLSAGSRFTITVFFVSFHFV
jgi:hypothetical protein